MQQITLINPMILMETPLSDSDIHLLNPARLGLNTLYLRQPITDFDKIMALVEKAKNAQQPLRLCYFWGVAHRTAANEHDLKGLDFLNEIVQRIAAVTQTEMALCLLLTDLHGLANLLDKNGINTYYEGIDAAAVARGFTTVHLSALFDADAMNDLYALATPTEQAIYTENYTILERGALKTGDISTAPLRILQYLTLRLRERTTVKAHFADTVLLCGDRPENYFLFPDMPTIPIYNTGYKRGHKAWLL
jgi:hypothetical protein